MDSAAGNTTEHGNGLFRDKRMRASGYYPHVLHQGSLVITGRYEFARFVADDAAEEMGVSIRDLFGLWQGNVRWAKYFAYVLWPPHHL